MEIAYFAVSLIWRLVSVLRRLPKAPEGGTQVTLPQVNYPPGIVTTRNYPY